MKNIKLTQKDLFNKLLPALRTKKHELHRIGLVAITEEDIWNYHKVFNWPKKVGLSISDMVDSILYTDDTIYINYLSNK